MGSFLSLWVGCPLSEPWVIWIKRALVEILTKPKNALMKQYQKLFEYEGVKLRFEEDALGSDC